jgi:NitT/TauT family transport system substrate-binding protein
MIRTLVVAIVLSMSILAAAGGSSAAASKPSNSSTVRTTTVSDYVGGVTTSAPQDYAASAEGIYAKYGLNVNFVVLSGTSQAVQAVAADSSGNAFTQGDILDEMLIQDNNPSAPPLIGVANTEPLNPVAVFYLKGNGINKPGDLIGKTIGVPNGSLSAQYLNVFLERYHIPLDKVTIQNIGFSAVEPALITKQVDAIAEFDRGMASLSSIASQHGVEVGAFAFSHYGIPTPVGAVVIQKNLMTENPAVAKAIARASTEALYFCVLHQVKCIQDFVAKNPGRDYAQSLAEWKVALKEQYGLDPSKVKKMKALQVGWFSPVVVKNNVPALKNLFGIKKVFPPTSLYTNKYVQRPTPPKNKK